VWKGEKKKRMQSEQEKGAEILIHHHCQEGGGRGTNFIPRPRVRDRHMKGGKNRRSPQRHRGKEEEKHPRKKTNKEVCIASLFLRHTRGEINLPPFSLYITIGGITKKKGEDRGFKIPSESRKRREKGQARATWLRKEGTRVLLRQTKGESGGAAHQALSQERGKEPATTEFTRGEEEKK